MRPSTARSVMPRPEAICLCVQPASDALQDVHAVLRHAPLAEQLRGGLELPSGVDGVPLLGCAVLERRVA